MSQRHDQGFTIIELVTVMLVIGILAAISVPNFISFSDEAKTSAAKSNAHTVQLSAEDFAVRNEGSYPATTAQVGVDGEALADLLPNGQLLVNPFTNVQSEPVNGAAADPGQVGYSPIVENGDRVGYMITVAGGDGVALTITNH